MKILYTLRVSLAITLILAGMILFPTPLPGGMPFMSIGLLILIRESKIAKRLIRRLRERSKRVNAVFNYVEMNAPGFVRRTLRRTRPLAKRAAVTA